MQCCKMRFFQWFPNTVPPSKYCLSHRLQWLLSSSPTALSLSTYSLRCWRTTKKKKAYHASQQRRDLMQKKVFMLQWFRLQNYMRNKAIIWRSKKKKEGKNAWERLTCLLASLLLPWHWLSSHLSCCRRSRSSGTFAHFSRCTSVI